MTCCVPQCKNSKSRNPELSYYRFPQHKETRKKWLQCIRRVNEDGSDWIPSSNARICSWHFTHGRDAGPTRVDQTYEPRYIPSKRKRKLFKPSVPKRRGGNRWCSAINCKNVDRANGELSFFRFPKDPERCKKWIVNCRRLDLADRSIDELYNSKRLCGEHFEQSQFMNPEKRKKLIWNAIPTLFDSPDPPSKVTSTKRVLKRQPKGEGNHPAAARKTQPEAPVPTSSKPSPNEVHSWLVTARDTLPEAEERTEITIDPGTHEFYFKEPVISVSSHDFRCYIRPISPSDDESSITKFQNEILRLRKENEELREKLRSNDTLFNYSLIQNDNERLLLYTGLVSPLQFEKLLSLYSSKQDSVTPIKNSTFVPEDELFVMLIVLRLNLPCLDVATRFLTDTENVTYIVHTVVHELHKPLLSTFLKYVAIPKNERKLLDSSYAFSLHQNVLVEHVDVDVEKPAILVPPGGCPSQSKKTFKALLAVDSNGVIVFTSELYNASVREEDIIVDSGLLQIFPPENLVIVDKPYAIVDLTNNVPRAVKRKGLTNEDVEALQKKYDGAVQRLNMFAIINLIPEVYSGKRMEIFQICCALTNFLK